MRRDDYPTYDYDADLIEAARRDGRTRVRVYRLGAPVVVLGSGSRPEVELDLSACSETGVPVMRRRGGGCSVVIDPGNIIVSVAASGLPFGRHQAYFDTITQWLIAGLARIGVPNVRQAGICDFAIDERKVGGACMHRWQDTLYYSTTLLVRPDFRQVMNLLQHPPREPEYRSGRSHEEFMGRLADAIPSAEAPPACLLDAEEVATRLRRTLLPLELGQASTDVRAA